MSIPLIEKDEVGRGNTLANGKTGFFIFFAGEIGMRVCRLISIEIRKIMQSHYPKNVFHGAELKKAVKTDGL